MVAIAMAQQKEVFLVNVLKMTILKKLPHNLDLQPSFALKMKGTRMLLSDKGHLCVWKRDKGPNEDALGFQKQPVNLKSTMDSSSMPSIQSTFIENINTEDVQLLQYLNFVRTWDCSPFVQKLETDTNEKAKVVTSGILPFENLLVVTEQGISLYKNMQERSDILRHAFGKELVFAKIVKETSLDAGSSLVVAVDKDLNLLIVEISNLEQQASARIVVTTNLISDSTLFEPFSIKTEGSTHLLSELSDDKDEKRDSLRKTLVGLVPKSEQNGGRFLKLDKDSMSLYTVARIQTTKEHAKEPCLVTWSLETILKNIHSLHQQQIKIPLATTPLRVFSSSSPNDEQVSLINFQPLLIKSFYNRHQFQFFYGDETVTESAIYTSAQNPSYIMATNYGRIFIVSMFQECDEKVQPVLVIDSHNSSPINQLFVAYNPSRKPYLANAARGMHLRGSNVRSTGTGSTPGLQDNGGHLICVSEDGTISVTNLNSGEIYKAVHNYTARGGDVKGIDRLDGSRADQFFEEKHSQKGLRRRNSFSNDFSVNHYYHLVKVRPQKIFFNAAFSKVDKIIEVKNLSSIREMLSVTRGDQQLSSVFMNNNKSAESATKGSKQLSTVDYRNGEDQLNSSSSSIRTTTSKGFPQLNSEEFTSYACISSEGGTIHVLQITNLTVEILQLSGMATNGEILGVYQDVKQHQVYVLSTVNVEPKKPIKPDLKKQQSSGKPESKQAKQQLQFLVFNSKSNLLLRRLDQRHAMDVLMVKEAVDTLLSKNEILKMKGGSSSFFDYEGFQQFFKQLSQKEEGSAAGVQSGLGGGQMGLGSHKLLDYLSLSANVPLELHPISPFKSTKYTKCMKDLIGIRQHLTIVGGGLTQQKLNPDDVQESQRQVIMALNAAYYLNNKLYRSDFNQEYFEKQTGTTTLQTTQGTFFGSKQNIVVANGKQVIKILQSKISKGAKQQAPRYTQPSSANGRVTSPTTGSRDGMMRRGEENLDFEVHEEEKFNGHQVPQPQNIRTMHQQSQQSNQANSLEVRGLTKWPTRLLSIIHPFNVELNLDDALERYLGLNLPFLDFRVGVQGSDESFSFVITREDEDFHSERANPIKLFRMLRLSSYKNSLLDKLKAPKIEPSRNTIGHVARSQPAGIAPQHYSDVQTIADINMQMDQLFESEPSVRFFGSELWKISGYLSTIIPTFFLSFLTGIVDYAKEDVTYMLQEWLFIVQRINQQKTLSEANRISLSASSKLLLKKEPSISSASRDVLLKPVLFALAGNTERLQDVIDEWTALVLDTYRKLKRETASRATGQSQTALQQNQAADKKLVNQYFGELEIRALICISYYALYNHDNLDNTVQYRVSKLTTILTREIVEKFNNDRSYIHLLTHLLQLLSIWMKMQNSQFSSKAMIGEVIRLLLFIYNINKSPLNRESVITRVTGENFYLIKPTQPELFLKLTSAKALLEVGENYTHDFLSIIQEEATHLNQGSDYQQNVLEILKIFINSSCTSNANDQQNGAAASSGVNLEHHLIQITQILLKCFDPNELALRKNSHRIVSIILSIMVKMFPMVAFHHESQRLAVGTHDGPIAIYDMRTSAKWKILEGHTGNITCVQFDSKGNLLASYSATDRTLQLWKVGNTGFFSTIMGGTSKSSNKINLKPLGFKNPHSKRLESTFLQQEVSRNESLFGDQQVQPTPSAPLSGGSSSSSKRVNSCYVKFMMPKEKLVELQREDGSREQFKLVK